MSEEQILVRGTWDRMGRPVGNVYRRFTITNDKITLTRAEFEGLARLAGYKVLGGEKDE